MNRWENSLYYARTFSPLLQIGIPRVNRFDIPRAQVLTSFTTPVTLLPAQQGYVNLPLWGELIRTTSYDTQQNILKLNWLPLPNGGVAFNFGATALTAATTNGRFAVFGNPPAHVSLDGSDGASAFGSKPLLFMATVGNPTVSAANPGSDISIILTWILLPTYIENVGGPITPTS